MEYVTYPSELWVTVFVLKKNKSFCVPTGANIGSYSNKILVCLVWAEKSICKPDHTCRLKEHTVEVLWWLVWLSGIDFHEQTGHRRSESGEIAFRPNKPTNALRVLDNKLKWPWFASSQTC